MDDQTTLCLYGHGGYENILHQHWESLRLISKVLEALQEDSTINVRRGL